MDNKTLKEVKENQDRLLFEKKRLVRELKMTKKELEKKNKELISAIKAKDFMADQLNRQIKDYELSNPLNGQIADLKKEVESLKNDLRKERQNTTKNSYEIRRLRQYESLSLWKIWIMRRAERNNIITK